MSAITYNGKQYESWEGEETASNLGIMWYSPPEHPWPNNGAKYCRPATRALEGMKKAGLVIGRYRYGKGWGRMCWWLSRKGRDAIMPGVDPRGNQ